MKDAAVVAVAERVSQSTDNSARSSREVLASFSQVLLAGLNHQFYGPF